MIDVESLVTPGQIARQLNEPLHRIRHVLDTRAGITPVRRIGIVRTYAGGAVDLVRSELRAIDDRRARHSKSVA